MDGSEFTKNPIYASLVGLGLAIVFFICIRQLICMHLQILPEPEPEPGPAAQEEEENPL